MLEVSGGASLFSETFLSFWQFCTPTGGFGESLSSNRFAVSRLAQDMMADKQKELTAMAQEHVVDMNLPNHLESKWPHFLHWTPAPHFISFLSKVL